MGDLAICETSPNNLPEWGWRHLGRNLLCFFPIILYFKNEKGRAGICFVRIIILELENHTQMICHVEDVKGAQGNFTTSGILNTLNMSSGALRFLATYGALSSQKGQKSRDSENNVG